MKSLLTAIVIVVVIILPSRLAAQPVSPWSKVCLESSSDEWSRCERYTRLIDSSGSWIVIKRTLSRDGILVLDVSYQASTDSIKWACYDVCDDTVSGTGDIEAILGDIYDYWQDGVFAVLPIVVRGGVWSMIAPFKLSEGELSE
ncbi:MAG: hypothetical protein PHY10_02690 [Patescibacteria group bacterium]|nr:hypothetical protein [Patescibacteria group bacterium]